jgi:hypothetical protein
VYAFIELAEAEQGAMSGYSARKYALCIPFLVGAAKKNAFRSQVVLISLLK